MSQTCIMVLGMHRSGTSALGGAMDAAGVCMGKNLMEATIDNPKGYFESKSIIDFNEQKLLPALERNWKSVTPLADGWENNPALSHLYDEARQVIQAEFEGAEVFGIKDPRICILLPFWRGVMKQMGIQVVAILPYRHPLEVARSLRKRDGFTLQQGMALWAEHVITAERYSRDMPRAFIAYSALLEDPLESMDKIARHTHVQWPRDREQIKAALDGFLEKKLRNHVAHDSDGLAMMPDMLQQITQHYEAATQAEQPPQDLAEHLDEWVGRYRQLQHFVQESWALLEVDPPAQLFIDVGEGFNSQHKIDRAVKTHGMEQLLRFSLDGWKNIKGLRFDPMPASCILELLEVGLEAQDGSMHVMEPGSHNAAVRDGKLFFFRHDDPQLYYQSVPEEKRDSAKYFFVRLKVLAHDKDADPISNSASNMMTEIARLRSELEKHAALQKSGLNRDDARLRSELEHMSRRLQAAQKNIAQLQSELVHICASGSWRYTRPIRKIMNKIRRMRRHGS